MRTNEVVKIEFPVYFRFSAAFQAGDPEDPDT